MLSSGNINLTEVNKGNCKKERSGEWKPNGLGIYAKDEEGGDAEHWGHKTAGSSGTVDAQKKGGSEGSLHM